MVVKLQEKKREKSRERRKNEKELKKVKNIKRRSASNLASIERRVGFRRQDLDYVSAKLVQKTAQKESILRLVSEAEEKIQREKDAKTLAERDADLAQNERDKANAKSRLKIVNEGIKETRDELRKRKNILKKVEEEIAQYEQEKKKLLANIRTQLKSRPLLKERIKESKKDVETFKHELQKRTQQEEMYKKRIQRIKKKIANLRPKRKSQSKPKHSKNNTKAHNNSKHSKKSPQPKIKR